MSDQEQHATAKARARARIKEYWAHKAAQEVADAATTKAKKPKLSSEIELGPEIVSVPADTNSSSDIKDMPSSDRDQIKPQPPQPQPAHPQPPQPPSSVIGLYVIREKNELLYDIQDPSCQKSGVPRYIKKYCILALEKYNNEKGTNYRYVSLLWAHEGGKTRNLIYGLKFRASQSDSDSDSKTFSATVTSTTRYAKGGWLVVREAKQVSLVRGRWPFAW